MNKTKNKLLVTALAIGFSVVGCGVLMGNASAASAYAEEPETVCVHEYITETVAPTCSEQGYTYILVRNAATVTEITMKKQKGIVLRT